MMKGQITMKLRKLALIICVAALVLALALCAGCGKKAPQTATFTMEANPTTGYTWQISQDNEIFDIAEEYVENEHAEGMVGVGGTQTYVLTPKAAGTATVTLVYGRSWEEGDSLSSAEYTFEVSRNMQIKTVSAKGAFPEEFSFVPVLEIK